MGSRRPSTNGSLFEMTPKRGCESSWRGKLTLIIPCVKQT
jgi:hypothetical protein